MDPTNNPAATESKTIYITYFDKIDALRVRGLMALCTQLISQYKPTVLHFLFSSPGGEVSAGITFYNFLKSLPVKIIMHNMGSIDSIATVIFLAGEERYAASHSTFLFHGVSLQINGGIHLSQLNEFRSGIQEDQNKIAGIIASNTKMKKKEIKNLFLQGESKTTSFAIEKGIINSVKQAIIPNGEMHITANFQ